MAGKERTATIPLAFLAVAGPKTQEKKELANAMLVDWQIDLKMQKKPKEKKKCEYYAPSTQNANLRTFFAHMNKNHNWQWTLKDFSNFPGCLNSMIGEIYDQRLDTFADEGYGKRDENARFTEEEAQLVDISKFNEDILEEHQEKCLIIFGCKMGFRGDDEHTYLMICQIGTGVYPSNHPLFPGYEWCGLISMGNEKRLKLGVKNDYVRTLSNGLGRFPILSDGKTDDVKRDIGGTIKRYIEKIPLDQRNGRFYRRISKDGKKLTNSNLGHNKIRERIQTQSVRSKMRL